MTRLVGSWAELRVAVAMPLLLVVPWVTVNPPDVATKFTAVPDTNWLLAFRTNAVIVAAFEPSEGICAEPVVKVIVCWIFTTLTVTLPETLPLEAVTVMVVPAAAVPAVRVAVAKPLASVVACVMARPPAEALKVTVAPDTKLFFESFA
ncbi:MAG: hypothetical protein M3N97_06370 [Pseudomonadota bacterium]|nr:hypothetical protein [Pseudomonadota bacterium]